LPPSPATLDAVTMLCVDLRIGFAEVASESSLRSVSNPSCLGGPGIRPRLSLIASASDVIRLPGTGINRFSRVIRQHPFS
jgi:hypothetical protein